MANSYTVTLEVQQTRHIALELVEVEADTEEEAIEVARKAYQDTGRTQFTLQFEEIGSEDITDAHAADSRWD